MNVISKLTYQRSSDGTFKSASISLGWSDLVRMVDEGRVVGYKLAPDVTLPGEVVVIAEEGETPIPLRDSIRVLQAEVDIQLWNYVYNDGGCQKEVAVEEMRKAKERAGILR